MDKMTWTEALFLTKGGLRGYRERNNIIISDEYKEATHKYMCSFAFWMGITAFFAGVAVVTF